MREVCVCVPARNEAARLPVLLDALDAQEADRPPMVVVCVNNSDDGGASVVRAWAGDPTRRIDLEVIERDFAPPHDHAGSARRAAMDRGADRLGRDGDVLISTDADCRPPPGWIAAILEAMSDDAIVGGRLALEPEERLDPAVLALCMRWDRYWREVRAIEDALDPCAYDPPPRHGDHTGASLALSVGLYRRAGGVPRLRLGEDLALVAAAQAVGGRLMHPSSVWTRVSVRTEGRATGGMATHMAELAASAARGLTPKAPDLSHWRERADWRRRMRAELSPGALAEAERALPPMPCDIDLPEASR